MAVDICEKCSALWLDGKKIEHLTDIIGPYKWKAAKGGSSGSTRRQR
jgi:Zn-finger nucleic acid-binding protein